MNSEKVWTNGPATNPSVVNLLTVQTLHDAWSHPHSFASGQGEITNG